MFQLVNYYGYDRFHHKAMTNHLIFCILFSSKDRLLMKQLTTSLVRIKDIVITPTHITPIIIVILIMPVLIIFLIQSIGELKVPLMEFQVRNKNTAVHVGHSRLRVRLRVNIFAHMENSFNYQNKIYSIVYRIVTVWAVV